MQRERCCMASTPAFLTLRWNRDETGRREVPIRRVLIVVVSLFLLAGLLNVFGQRPQTVHAASHAASLKLYAPTHVRGGLYSEARFTIDAHQDIKNAMLEGTINIMAPSPLGEASRNGNLLFTRLQKIDSVERIRWAALVTTGRISFIKQE